MNYLINNPPTLRDPLGAQHHNVDLLHDVADRRVQYEGRLDTHFC